MDKQHKNLSPIESHEDDDLLNNDEDENIIRLRNVIVASPLSSYNNLNETTNYSSESNRNSVTLMEGDNSYATVINIEQQFNDCWDDSTMQRNNEDSQHEENGLFSGNSSRKSSARSDGNGAGSCNGDNNSNNGSKNGSKSGKVQVKPFTKKSLDRLENKTVQLVREYGFQPRRKLSVEDGSILPVKYEPFPKKLYGRPLEEIDNFIYDEVRYS